MPNARNAFIQQAFLLLILFSLTSLAFAQTKGVRVQQRNSTAGENRVALVIGNAKYAVSPLRNPVNDARAMAHQLRKIGFEVIALENATQRQMKKAINVFGRKIREGGVGLFYYSGHGMQVGGKNYMLPIGAEVETEQDVEIEAVGANRVLAKMHAAANRMNIVILDACRNNPFARSFRSSAQGLATMDAPAGTLIAYATAPGRVAADGTGKNGLYTGQLIRFMQIPGLKLEEVFKRARAEVSRRSDGRQVPWEASSLTGDFYFAKASMESTALSFEPAARTRIQPNSGPAKTINVEETFWKAIEKSTHPDDFQEYLKNYPQGRFAVVARLKMKQLGRKRTGLPPQRTPLPVTPSPRVRRPLDGRPVVVVDQNGNGDFTKISAAISAAKPGSVVRIMPGRYRESLSITKELHLEGGGRTRGEVVIEARNGTCLKFDTQIGSVKNMTFRMLEGKHFCVDIRKGRLVLEGNDISSKGLASVGIRGDGTNPIVRNNNIHGSAQGGILVYKNALGKIENNDIFQNKLAGIEIRQGADPLVIGNKVHHGRAGGILVQKNGKGRLEKNEIYKNYFTGIEIRENGDPLVTGNRIYDGRQSGIFVQKKGRGRIENNDIYRNKMGGVWVQTGGDPFVIGNRIYNNTHNNKPNDIIKKKSAKGIYRNNSKRF